MDIDELFNNKHYNKDRFRHDESKIYFQNKHKSDYKKQLIIKILNNTKLRAIILIGVLFIIMVFIALIYFLFPLLIELLNIIRINGISGIIDLLWNGTKK